MQWSRVKSIFIGVFIVVNIILLAFYLSLNHTENKISDDAIESTLTILHKNNISIDEKLLSNKYNSGDLFEITNKYPTPRIMLEDLSKNTDYKFNDTNTTYNGNYFEYLNNAVVSEQSNLNVKTAESFAEKTAKEIGLINKNYVITVWAKDENFVVSFNPSYNDVKILDIVLWIEVGKKGIVKIAGDNWLCDSISGGTRVTIRPYTEVLTNFATSNKSEGEVVKIKSLDYGYYVGGRYNEVRTITAIPTWLITTADNKFFYDARNSNILSN